MATVNRRKVLAMLGLGGGLVGLGGIIGLRVFEPRSNRLRPRVMMMNGPPNMDMGLYMEMFNRHRELRRTVEEIPGGVRTTTESDSPDLVAQLQTHVTTMYSNVDQGAEVMCMSGTLPTLFRNAVDYQRQLTLTPKGVVAVETSSDPNLTQVIRAHAAEVTGFVNEGMPAMMGPMMGPGGMMGPGMMRPNR
ncbi:MAG: hypothetical protein ACXWZL_08075 [Mycobacterium sp.]